METSGISPLAFSNIFTASPLSSFKAKRASISDQSFDMLMFMKENSLIKDSFNFVKKEAELVAAAEAVESLTN
jgi:hypothetical protein